MRERGWPEYNHHQDCPHHDKRAQHRGSYARLTRDAPRRKVERAMPQRNHQDTAAGAVV